MRGENGSLASGWSLGFIPETVGVAGISRGDIDVPRKPEVLGEVCRVGCVWRLRIQCGNGGCLEASSVEFAEEKTIAIVQIQEPGPAEALVSYWGGTARIS